ncbi:MAG TPA: purine-nucleoside phosphorylase [Deltaproteobacteria bacterium]|nr:purine-nucleoside phosphorylase [Deltaproteobacteria bacterium]
MNAYVQKALESSNFIKKEIETLPLVGLITGTGLGDIAHALNVETIIEYRKIPHFPETTVESHHGRLIFGSLGTCRCLVMQGRFHLYEGYSPLEVTFPIRVMQELGVTHLILSNAAGGLNPGFQPGDIMLISDHINLTGSNPLIGPNESRWGSRFPDMARAYDGRWMEHAKKAGKKLGIPLQAGVYAGLKGPSLETPAEVRFLRTIGADAVGFSTVSEVIAAVHAGMTVIGFSTITNVHDPDHPEPASVSDILDVAEAAAPNLSAILEEIAADLAPTPGK